LRKDQICRKFNKKKNRKSNKLQLSPYKILIKKNCQFLSLTPQINTIRKAVRTGGLLNKNNNLIAIAIKAIMTNNRTQVISDLLELGG
jgi:hypothetical protein